MTKDDGEGLRKDDELWKIQGFKGIHPKKASLGSTEPLFRQMDGQLNKQWPINNDGNKMDSKHGMSLDDVINLKHQGAKG